MAETFKTTCISSIGTAATVGLGPVPAATTFVITAALLANTFTSASTAIASVYVSNNAGGAGRSWLVRGANIPANQTLPLLGTNTRGVMEASDSLVFKCASGGNSADLWLSYLEIT